MDVLNPKLAEQILEFERACFAKPWSNVSLTEHSICIIYEYGYALGVRLSGECELLRIAVLPEFRGKGYGLSLMREFLGKCKKARVFLEVASKNTHAIRLYEKVGFEQISCRKGYYGDDDAIVMAIKRM
ncbi:MAG: GNAT family N-acetyltransferase [Oscillospiraceae bacterium]|nr:GNAT family N-acetyltransferase [Oscillospiraceae bacterium]